MLILKSINFICFFNILQKNLFVQILHKLTDKFSFNTVDGESKQTLVRICKGPTMEVRQLNPKGWTSAMHYKSCQGSALLTWRLKSGMNI